MILIQNEIELLETFVDAFEPIDTRPVDEWATTNINFDNTAYAAKGNFNPHKSPYLKKPMGDLTNPKIKQLNFSCSTQTFKSGINEIFTVWALLQNPAPTLRIHQKDDAAVECMTTRIMPLMKNNPSSKRLLDVAKWNTKTGMLMFPNGMFIKACGTAETNLQSKTIQNLIIEEVKFYKESGVIQQAKARTEQCEKTKKIIIASEPDYEGSEFHNEFVSGDVFEWGWRCPHCDKLQKYEFDGERDGKYYGLIWRKNNKEGTLTDDQRTDDTRLVCQHCFGEVMDNEECRLKLLNNGDYILTSNGNSSIHSYSWPSIVNVDLSFKAVAMEYLKEKRIKQATGIIEGLHTYFNKKWGIFIKRGQLLDMPKLMADISNVNESWPDETHRFLTIDAQHDCYYWMVTAWSNKIPEARLIDWGVCASPNDLLEVKKKYNIKPMYIGIDSGNDTKPIYRESVMHGELYKVNGKDIFIPWLCLKGDGGQSKLTPKYDYTHPDGQKRYYNVPTRPECHWPYGSKWSAFKARLVVWSNYSIKKILTNVRDGKVAFKFRYNERADETFTRHMFSEKLDDKGTRFEQIEGVPNHLFDCLCEAYVLAFMSNCYIPATADENNPLINT